MKTPDITLAQIIGIASAAIATATAFGVDLSATQQHVLLADVAAVGGLFLGDAVIRHGRATGRSTTVQPTDEQVREAVAGVISAMAASSVQHHTDPGPAHPVKAPRGKVDP